MHWRPIVIGGHKRPWLKYPLSSNWDIIIRLSTGFIMPVTTRLWLCLSDME